MREQLEATDSFKGNKHSLNNLTIGDENTDYLRSQVELNQQEKQAYYMISNDIQNLIASAIGDMMNGSSGQ